MKGEEFFGEVKERRAIEDFDVKGWLGALLFLGGYYFLVGPKLHNLTPLVDVFLLRVIC